MVDEANIYGYSPAADDIITIGRQNEASFHGNMGIEAKEAVAASGVDNQDKVLAAYNEHVNKVAAAIAKGEPPSQVAVDPALGHAAAEAAAQQAAQGANTTVAALEQKHKEEQARDMEAVQHAMGGVVVLAVAGAAPAVVATLAGATNHEGEQFVLNDEQRHLVSTTQVIAEMGARGGFQPDTTPAQQVERGRGQERDGRNA